MVFSWTYVQYVYIYFIYHGIQNAIVVLLACIQHLDLVITILADALAC